MASEELLMEERSSSGTPDVCNWPSFKEIWDEGAHSYAEKRTIVNFDTD